MVQNNKPNGRMEPPPKPPSLDELRSSMEFMKKALDTLQDNIKVLPPVDKKGNSECSFARELYDRAEKEYQAVAQRIEKLKTFLPVIAKKLAALRENAKKIAADKAFFKYESAQRKYDFALSACQYHYQKRSQERKDLIALIKQAGEALKLAREKIKNGERLPKRTRQPVFSFGMNPTLNGPSPNFSVIEKPAASPPSTSPPLASKNPIPALMELGPLTGRK